jgi:hypothetical protein
VLQLVSLVHILFWAALYFGFASALCFTIMTVFFIHVVLEPLALVKELDSWKLLYATTRDFYHGSSSTYCCGCPTLLSTRHGCRYRNYCYTCKRLVRRRRALLIACLTYSTSVLCLPATHFYSSYCRVHLICLS